VLGYVHDVMENGNLFVPTRHQHTKEVLEKEKFDHEIFSVNTLEDVRRHDWL